MKGNPETGPDGLPGDYAVLVREFPFFSIIRVGRGDVVVGVVVTVAPSTLVVYDYRRIKNVALRVRFVRMCEHWWWKGNRKVPPDVWWGHRFTPFRPALIGLPRNGSEIVLGRDPKPPPRDEKWRSVNVNLVAEAVRKARGE